MLVIVRGKVKCGQGRAPPPRLRLPYLLADDGELRIVIEWLRRDDVHFQLFAQVNEKLAAIGLEMSHKLWHDGHVEANVTRLEGEAFLHLVGVVVGQHKHGQNGLLDVRQLGRPDDKLVVKRVVHNLGTVDGRAGHRAKKANVDALAT